MNPLHIALGARAADTVVRATLERIGITNEAFASTAALRDAVREGVRSRPFDGLLIDSACGGIDWRPFVDSRRGWTPPGAFIVVAGAASDVAACALAAGADDFVALPPSPAELLARLEHARRRRRPAAAAGVLQALGAEVDAARQCLRGARGEVALTARECALAERLFSHAGRVVSRRSLAEQVWHCDESVAGRAIEQHIYQLRRKLKLCGNGAPALRGIYGGGYRLEPTSGETQ